MNRANEHADRGGHNGRRHRRVTSAHTPRRAGNHGRLKIMPMVYVTTSATGIGQSASQDWPQWRGHSPCVGAADGGARDLPDQHRRTVGGDAKRHDIRERAPIRRGDQCHLCGATLSQWRFDCARCHRYQPDGRGVRQINGVTGMRPSPRRCARGGCHPR